MKLIYLLALVHVLSYLDFSVANYIGIDVIGKNLVNTDPRADTEKPLTYIFVKNQYTATTTTTIKFTEVNFATQYGGKVTPFIALYTPGGNAYSGSSYKLLLLGDAITAPDNSVVNAFFTVGGSLPSPVGLQAGQTIVAGAYQEQNTIKFGQGQGSFFDTIIWRNNVIPTGGSSFPVTPDWNFNFQNYRFNIGFEPTQANSLNYIGSSVNIPSSPNLSERADTVTELTYIFLQYTYTATSSVSLTFGKLTTISQNDGILTPLVVLYNGGSKQTGESYTLFLKGDPIAIPANTRVSVPFTVGGQPATVILSAGQTIAVGAYQPTNIIRFAWDTSASHDTIIWQGNTIPLGKSNIFPKGNGWYFTNQYYHFNLAFNAKISNALNYFGSDISGRSLSYANQRADTVPELTYIFLQVQKTLDYASKVNFSEVNLISQNEGYLTPFVAIYNGGPIYSGSSYNLLVQGDPIKVTANSLINAAFKVGGSSPSFYLPAGTTLVAGAYQPTNIIQFGSGPSDTLIWGGNVLPTGIVNAFPANPGWHFNSQLYRYNLGILIEDLQYNGASYLRSEETLQNSVVSFLSLNGSLLAITGTVVGVVVCVAIVVFAIGRSKQRVHYSEDNVYLRQL